MTDKTTNSLYSFRSVILFASTCFFILAVWIANHSSVIRLSGEDDVQYLYYTSAAIIDADRHREMSGQVSKFINEKSDSASHPYRFDEREKVVKNYFFPTSMIALTRLFFEKDFQQKDKNYADIVASILNLSFHISFTVCLFILGFVIFLVRDELLAGTVFGLVMILIIQWFFPWRPPHWILHYWPRDLTEVFERILQTITLVFTAGGISSIFPRDNFILLAISIFLLRWSAKYQQAYILLLIASLFHLSMSALLALCFLATDFLLRREIIRTKFNLLIVSIILGLFFSNGLIISGKTLPSTALTWTIGLGATFAIFTIIRFFPTKTLLGPFTSIVNRINTYGPIVSDLLMLYTLWVIILPVAVAMYFYIGGPWNLWTWGELPGRYLMFMSGPLTIGISILFVEWLQKQKQKYVLLYSMAGLALSCILIFHAINLKNTFELTPVNLGADLQVRTETARQVEKGANLEYVEADVYFMMSRAIDLKKPFPIDSLIFTIDACSRRQSTCE